MTHAALTPLVGPEFDDFLFASIGDDHNGTSLSVVSALARLDLDPWQEAIGLARMPRREARERLTALIASMPKGPAIDPSSAAVAARLIALLPQAGTFSFAPPKAPARATGNGRSRLFAMAIAIAVALAASLIVSALHSTAPVAPADPPGASAAAPPPR